jgi:hypothetical protein
MKKSSLSIGVTVVASQIDIEQSEAFTSKLRPEFSLDVRLGMCSDCLFPHPINVLCINWYDNDGLIKESSVIPYDAVEALEAYLQDMKNGHRAAFKALVRFAIDTMSDNDDDLNIQDLIFDVCNESERLAIWLKEVLTEQYFD